MSRLVDPKPAGARFANAQGQISVKEYLERVAKYVPSEIIAAYVAVNGAIPAAPPRTQPYLTVGVFFLCLVLTPFYLCRMADPDQPKLKHLVVSTFAFVVWAYAVAGNTGVFSSAFLNWYNAALASIVLTVFTLISGAFVPLAPAPPGPGA